MNPARGWVGLVSILVPGPPEEVKFLRARLRIENVTLPQATD